jgi:hypothetical protein
MYWETLKLLQEAIINNIGVLEVPRLVYKMGYPHKDNQDFTVQCSEHSL